MQARLIPSEHGEGGVGGEAAAMTSSGFTTTTGVVRPFLLIVVSLFPLGVRHLFLLKAVKKLL